MNGTREAVLDVSDEVLLRNLRLLTYNGLNTCKG